MKTEERIAAGVYLLMWVLVYLFAISVLLMDLLVWRPG
jgi:hypothetical protein